MREHHRECQTEPGHHQTMSPPRRGPATMLPHAPDNHRSVERRHWDVGSVGILFVRSDSSAPAIAFKTTSRLPGGNFHVSFAFHPEFHESPHGASTLCNDCSYAIERRPTPVAGANSSASCSAFEIRGRRPAPGRRRAASSCGSHSIGSHRS